MKIGEKVKSASFVALLVLSCVLISLLTIQWTKATTLSAHPSHPGHEWLHEELNLTVQEKDAVQSFEKEYIQERALLLHKFNQRIEHLAELLTIKDELTPEVEHAIHELHLVHGQLQQLSIVHYYQMISVLPPEKQETLRSLAVEALSQPE